MKRFEKPELNITLFGSEEIKCALGGGGNITDSDIPLQPWSLDEDVNTKINTYSSPKATLAPSNSSAFY